MSYEKLKEATIAIASVCDFAREKDFAGYNKPDTMRGHQLANTLIWKQAWAIDMYERIRKYKNQLEQLEINYEAIPHPKTEKAEWENDNGNYYYSQQDLEFIAKNKYPFLKPALILTYSQIRKLGYVINYNARTLISIDALNAAKLNWTIEEIDAIFQELPVINTRKGELRKSDIFHLEIKYNFKHFWDYYKAEGKAILKENNYSVSKDINTGSWVLCHWGSFNQDEEDSSIYTSEPEAQKQQKLENIDEFLNQSILYEYQKSHTINLINSIAANNVVADTSSTGTGKTYCNLHAAKYLKLKIFVVCPIGVVTSWKASADVAGVEILGISNYELLQRGKQIDFVYSKRAKRILLKKIDSKYVDIVIPERVNNYTPKKTFTWNLPDDAILIFDEAHRCKNPRTINAQMMISASKQKIRMSLVSATLGEDPLKMMASGMALKLFDEEWQFYMQFLPEYDCRKETVNRRGQEAWVSYANPATLQRLHNTLENKISGMKKDELRAAGLFPDTQIIVESMNMNGNAAKIEEMYEEMAILLAELKEKEGDYKWHAEMSDDDASHLKIIQKQLQQIELLKIPTMLDMIEDLIENNHSVVIFANFIATIEEFVSQLNKRKITSVTYYGKNTSAQNEHNRQIFQENKARVIMCNSAAAKEGIDLHDVHHVYSRAALIYPNYSAQVLKQILGRVDRAGGSDSIQYIIYAANTREEEVCAIVKTKIAKIEALNTGELLAAVF